MSHNVSIKDIKITNIDALRMAVNELKGKGVDIDFVENGTYRAYYSHQQKEYPFVVRLNKNKYDVALEPAKDGEGYDLVYDPFGNKIRDVIGYNANEVDKNYCDVNSPNLHLGKLLQAYNLNVAEQAAAAQGYSTQRQYDEKTKVENLIVTGY
jgi:hypothetical protein